MPNDKFAIREIQKYYKFGSSTQYFKCINQTILNLENGITDLDDLKSNDELENKIIKTLLSVFLDKLDSENTNSGILGVSKAFFSDGISWCYKNPIKKEFAYTEMIYANSLSNLRVKVKNDNGIWYIFDFEKLEKAQNPPKKNKREKKSRKKTSKSEYQQKNQEKT